MRNWNLTHSYLIGKTHIDNDLPCQDYAQSFQNEHYTIAALSDGCGSSSHSDIGAKIVTETTIRLLSEEFDSIVSMGPIDSRKYILDSINGELEHKAQELDVDIKELNATLLFVVVKDNQELLLGHLGDGYIGSIQSSKLEIKSVEEKSDEVNGTVYTTTPNAFASFNLRKGSLKDYEGFILMSDGSGDALVDSRVPFQKKFVNSVGTIMSYVSSHEDAESQNAVEEYLKKVRDHIASGDDCSVSIMVLDDTQIQDISTYHVPKPEIKPESKSSRPVYSFNPAYQAYFDYISNLYHESSIDFVDKVLFSKLVDFVLKKGSKPLELKDYLHVDELLLHIKHLIHDGY